VIDDTGIVGLFDFRLEFTTLALDSATQLGVPTARSIFTAVEQLGLKLESARGPGEFLVIDSIERPTEN
jgi:uncharacterized protein (TIGR03435 family)